jgi:hypothetical protein
LSAALGFLSAVFAVGRPAGLGWQILGLAVPLGAAVYLAVAYIILRDKRD